MFSLFIYLQIIRKITTNSCLVYFYIISQLFTKLYQNLNKHLFSLFLYFPNYSKNTTKSFFLVISRFPNYLQNYNQLFSLFLYVFQIIRKIATNSRWFTSTLSNYSTNSTIITTNCCLVYFPNDSIACRSADTNIHISMKIVNSDLLQRWAQLKHLTRQPACSERRRPTFCTIKFMNRLFTLCNRECNLPRHLVSIIYALECPYVFTEHISYNINKVLAASIQG